jgi:hypothetical protein
MNIEVTNLNCPVCNGYQGSTDHKLTAEGSPSEVVPPYRIGECRACKFSTRVYKLSNGSWTLNQVEALQDYLDAKKRSDEADAARNPRS